MERKGKVYINDKYAGFILQNENGYLFKYDNEYLKQADAEPVSLTMPLREESYKSKILFPFFDGLIPEGWLLEIAQNNWKIDRRDRMKLLLTICQDCIGNVSIIEEKQE